MIPNVHKDGILFDGHLNATKFLGRTNFSQVKFFEQINKLILLKVLTLSRSTINCNFQKEHLGWNLAENFVQP